MISILVLVAPILASQPATVDRRPAPVQSEPAPASNPYANPNALVFRGRLKALSRTKTQAGVFEDDDGRITVSNRCSYNVGTFEFRDVVVGSYDQREILTHLHLGERCASILQTEVRDDLVHTIRSDGFWEVDRELTSPRLRARGRSMWLVEPRLLEYLAAHHLATAQPVHFRDTDLDELAAGRMASQGVLPMPGEPLGAWTDAMRSWWTPSDGGWGNPQYFDRGVELEAFRSAIAAMRPME